MDAGRQALDKGLLSYQAAQNSDLVAFLIENPAHLSVLKGEHLASLPFLGFSGGHSRSRHVSVVLC
jgi:hypothetical protein